MRRVLLAPRAELLDLHPFLLGAAVLGGVVVVLLAYGASERNHWSDVFCHTRSIVTQPIVLCGLSRHLPGHSNDGLQLLHVLLI
jgi:hypothetical protein